MSSVRPAWREKQNKRKRMNVVQTDKILQKHTSGVKLAGSTIPSIVLDTCAHTDSEVMPLTNTAAKGTPRCQKTL